ncbi:MAG: Rpn family recombination-promoting nuclease/putative transposase [Methanobrevibacter sp.]|nr:Rpn family recombination-promoting nuclease/putative transposase [Methanobrevibacter sp.]
MIKISNDEENINFLNDYLFPKIFGEKGCEEETLYLINTLAEKNFKSLTYVPNELKGKYKMNKKSITDVLVKIDDDNYVSIEAQIEKQDDFHKRCQFYYCKMTPAFLLEGDDYENLPLVVMINILNFNLHKTGYYRSKFVPWDEICKKLTLDDIQETHFIELPTLRRELKKRELDLNDPKVRLNILFNKKTPKKLLQKVIKMDKHINKMYEKAQLALQNQEEYLAYIRAEQAELDRKAQIKYGERKGERNGVKKGKIEGKMEVAIKLKKLAYPIKEIAEVTGISVEKIREI